MKLLKPVSTWAQLFCFALMFAASHPALGQGSIVFVQPQQPIYYSYLLTSQPIDVDGDGTPDFNLTSPNGIEIDLNPLNNNAILAVPEPPPDTGVLISALSQGTSISSSLDPVMVWYGQNSPYGGSATIVASANTGSIGYFSGHTNAYAGFQLNENGNAYYGWFYIQNLGLNVGQITSWAYETDPNTPIMAGAVPEPSTDVLLLIGGGFFTFREYRKRITGRPLKRHE